jgi:hypothetical protein
LKFFLNNGDEHLCGHGAPDLRLDCVLAVAKKLLDAQVLLDPSLWYGREGAGHSPITCLFGTAAIGTCENCHSTWLVNQ